jgi:hypothetical protein
MTICWPCYIADWFSACNSVLADGYTILSTLAPLQRVQNSAVPLTYDLRLHEYVTCTWSRSTSLTISILLFSTVYNVGLQAVCLIRPMHSIRTGRSSPYMTDMVICHVWRPQIGLLTWNLSADSDENLYLSPLLMHAKFCERSYAVSNPDSMSPCVTYPQSSSLNQT